MQINESIYHNTHIICMCARFMFQILSQIYRYNSIINISTLDAQSNFHVVL